MRNRGRTGRDITDRWPEEEEVSSGFMDRLLIRYCISGYSSGRNGISSAESCRGSLLTAVYTVVKKDFYILEEAGAEKVAVATRPYTNVDTGGESKLVIISWVIVTFGGPISGEQTSTLMPNEAQ